MTYAVLAAQPDYYTAAKTVCQYLFEIFFKNFFAQAIALAVSTPALAQLC